MKPLYNNEMKNKKISVVILTLLLLSFGSLPAAAAPIVEGVAGNTAVFAEAVNLPGWLGGVLALLSLILPIAAFIWYRQ